MRKILPNLPSYSSGQTVLVVLLVMAVILTVGLSVVSRSVTDLKISQQTQEAARAFWVAQAGLDQAIKANASELSGQMDQISYVVKKRSLGGGPEFAYPGKIRANEPVSLWLVDHDEASGEIITTGSSHQGTVIFYWGEPGTPSSSATTPALEMTLIYSESGVFKIHRYVYDPYPGRSSGFAAPNAGATIDGRAFAFSTNAINLTDFEKPYVFRVKLLFNDLPQSLGVKSNLNIPIQGNCQDSSAVINESKITRKIEDCRLWLDTPQIFDYSLFSGGSI